MEAELTQSPPRDATSPRAAANYRQLFSDSFGRVEASWQPSPASVLHSKDPADHMAQTSLTPEGFVAAFAQRAGLSTEQIRRVLQVQADLASELVGTGFPIPGIGLLTRTETPAGTVNLHYGPDAGKKRDIPAAKKLKFWIAPAIKDVAISGHAKMADVFTVDWYWPRDKTDAPQQP